MLKKKKTNSRKENRIFREQGRQPSKKECLRINKRDTKNEQYYVTHVHIMHACVGG